MATANFGWTELTAGQDNKYVTINDGFNAIDRRLSDPLTVLVDNSNAATISQANYLDYGFLIIDEDSPVPTAGITITVPTDTVGWFVVRNDTAQTVTVEITAQSKTSPTVLTGEEAIFTTDGVDIMKSATSTGSGGIAGTDGWENVEVKDVTVGATEIDIAIPTDAFALRLVGWVAVNTDDAELHGRVSDDNAVTFESGAADYRWVDPRVAAGAGESITGDNADDRLDIATNIGNATDERCSIDIKVITPRDSGEFTDFIWDNARLNGTPTLNVGYGGGQYNVASTLTHFRLFPSAGTMTGKFMVQKLVDTI